MSQEIRFYRYRYGDWPGDSAGSQNFLLFRHDHCPWANGAILADRMADQYQSSEADMQVICSWCRGEGRVGLVGEKAPFEDRRETHSICIEHAKAVRVRWTVCQRSISSCRTSGERVRYQFSWIRRVARLVERFYAASKIRM